MEWLGRPDLPWIDDQAVRVGGPCAGVDPRAWTITGVTGNRSAVTARRTSPQRVVDATRRASPYEGIT